MWAFLSSLDKITFSGTVSVLSSAGAEKPFVGFLQSRPQRNSRSPAPCRQLARIQDLHRHTVRLARVIGNLPLKSYDLLDKSGQLRDGNNRRDRWSAADLCLVHSPYQCSYDVQVIRTEIIAWTKNVRRNGRDELHPVLPAVCLAELDAGNLCNRKAR